MPMPPKTLRDDGLTYCDFVEVISRIDKMGLAIARCIADEFFGGVNAEYLKEQTGSARNEAAYQIARWAQRRAQEMQKAA